MNIFLNEHFGFCLELNFELNHFWARFIEKMNFQNGSARASWWCWWNNRTLYWAKSRDFQARPQGLWYWLLSCWRYQVASAFCFFESFAHLSGRTKWAKTLNAIKHSGPTSSLVFWQCTLFGSGALVDNDNLCPSLFGLIILYMIQRTKQGAR